MSQLYADEQRSDITTVPETLFIFGMFAFILIILYPKDMIREQILSESSNYDLTAIYLENMLKIEPENIDLMVAMAKVSVQTGKVDLAERLLTILLNQPDKAIQIEAYALKYTLLKHKRGQYLSNEDLDHTIYTLINTIAKNRLFNEEDAIKWYSEAVNLSQKEAALAFIKPLYSKDNIYWLEQCLYLSIQLKHYDYEREYCINKLLLVDKDRESKWLLTSYEIALADKHITKALKIAHKLSEKNPKYIDEPARLQLQLGEYKKASDFYLNLYKKSKKEYDKTLYFSKALESLQHGNLRQEIITLTQQYEDHFIHDDLIINKMLRVYLGTDNLEQARILSLKVLKAKGIQ